MFSREVEFIPADRSTEIPAQRVERDKAQAAREAGL
jgi:hypothetical protein